MAEAPGALTGSAQAAVRWAWAAAATRTGSDTTPPDSLDLLAGIALAHLTDDSPAQELFDHFDIPLGAALSAAGPRRYPANALLRAMDRVPEDKPPPSQGDVAEIVGHATGVLPRDEDGLTRLFTLFGALLETTHPASAAVRRLLAERGEDAEAVVRSYREHLGGRETYAEILRQRHPRRPVELPPYAADEPLPRRADRDTDPGGSDLVGITAEVDAFAYLLASQRLAPPLAVGLFGDWGSGKSYFLRSLQRRIDQITAAGSASAPTPFHTAVAQIEFNAWQYVEGDLWASLLEHIFRNLRTSPDDSDELLSQRQNYYLAQVDETATARARAEEERAALAQKRVAAAAEVRRRLDDRVVAVAELERRRREQPIPASSLSKGLRTLRAEVVRRAGLEPVATEAAGIAVELQRSEESLREAGALLAPLRRRGWGYAVALIAVLLLTPVVALVLDALDFSAVTAAAGSVAWLFAVVAGYLKIGNNALRAGLDKVAQARRTLDEEADAARGTLDTGIAQAEQELAEVGQALTDAEEEVQALDAEAATLAAELAAVNPARVLNEFIAERTGSDDYRRHLGVPAVVRRDLERLSRLVAQQCSGHAEHAVDRVVLYIDDLDRCPTELVVKVLAAVHLLLAFPLFVVVVAVDSRWLESSLRQHYTQLQSGGGAVPSDYLEKIFQVPFWVRPLDADIRRGMVRGLLAPSLRAGEGETADASTAAATSPRPSSPVASDPEFLRVVESFSHTTLRDRSWSAAADLTVTAAELVRIEELAGLLGATPRTLKRFVNVYLLVTSMGRGQGWTMPEQGQVALLLAMVTTMPDLADALAPTLRHAASPPLPLSTVVPTQRPAGPAGEQHGRLAGWLAAHPHWGAVDMSGLGPWIEAILRFTFTRREPVAPPP